MITLMKSKELTNRKELLKADILNELNKVSDKHFKTLRGLLAKREHFSNLTFDKFTQEDHIESSETNSKIMEVEKLIEDLKITIDVVENLWQS